MTAEYTHSGIVGKARIFYKYSSRRQDNVPIVANIETAGLDERNDILICRVWEKDMTATSRSNRCVYR